jgi:hypothetical protein
MVWDPLASGLIDTGSLLIGAMRPGALQPIWVNRFADENGIQAIDAGNYKAGVIVDPYTGIPFDYIANLDCGTWNVQMGITFDVVAPPSDMFSSADRMDGVNWINRFRVVNP